MIATTFRALAAAGLALALLPLPAGAQQGLPTGKRQHKPVSVTTKPAASADEGYQLDAEAGELRFGDGAQGRRPPSSESAETVPSYRTGTPSIPPTPAGATPSQHGQSDLDFLKERTRKAQDAPGEQEDRED
jgi:hypothetical protein